MDARNASTSESIPSKVHGIVELISEVFCSTYAMAAHARTSQSFGASGGAKELKGAEPPGSRCLQPTLPGIACTYGLCRPADLNPHGQDLRTRRVRSSTRFEDRSTANLEDNVQKSCGELGDLPVRVASRYLHRESEVGAPHVAPAAVTALVVPSVEGLGEPAVPAS